MKEKLHQLMQNIKKDLIFLANEVEHSLRLSMKALERQNVQLAEQVKQMDNDIDQLELLLH